MQAQCSTEACSMQPLHMLHAAPTHAPCSPCTCFVRPLHMLRAALAHAPCGPSTCSMRPLHMLHAALKHAPCGPYKCSMPDKQECLQSRAASQPGVGSGTASPQERAPQPLALSADDDSISDDHSNQVSRLQASTHYAVTGSILCRECYHCLYLCSQFQCYFPICKITFNTCTLLG